MDGPAQTLALRPGSPAAVADLMSIDWNWVVVFVGIGVLIALAWRIGGLLASSSYHSTANDVAYERRKINEELIEIRAERWRRHEERTHWYQERRLLNQELHLLHQELRRLHGALEALRKILKRLARKLSELDRCAECPFRKDPRPRRDET